MKEKEAEEIGSMEALLPVPLSLYPTVPPLPKGERVGQGSILPGWSTQQTLEEG